MEKVFEALQILRAKGVIDTRYCKKIELDKYLDILEQALLELQAIKNAEPSEALACLGKMGNTRGGSFDFNLNFKTQFPDEYATIKQALLKSQEQEKILNELLILINDIEPTFNRKGVSSDIAILGTIFRDYFIDNASVLLKRWLKNGN